NAKCNMKVPQVTGSLPVALCRLHGQYKPDAQASACIFCVPMECTRLRVGLVLVCLPSSFGLRAKPALRSRAVCWEPAPSADSRSPRGGSDRPGSRARTDPIQDHFSKQRTQLAGAVSRDVLREPLSRATLLEGIPAKTA